MILKTTDLEKYITRIADRCNSTHSQVEETILTQLALLLGDLACTHKCDILIGEVSVDIDNKFTMTPNDFLSAVLEGEIDPLILLNELIKRT